MGNVQTGHSCNGSGICLDQASKDCKDFACSAGECKTVCAGDSDCADTAYCDTASTACTPKASDGSACTEANTCQSGFCVDGLCCDQACGGQCEACDVGTAKGKCSPVVGSPHGTRPVCEKGMGDTGDARCGARACDGAASTASCIGYVGADVGAATRRAARACRRSRQPATARGSAARRTRSRVDHASHLRAEQPPAKSKCAADADCAPSYRCDTASSKCISGATCDGDHTINAPGQPPTDCRPYEMPGGRYVQVLVQQRGRLRRRFRLRPEQPLCHAHLFDCR